MIINGPHDYAPGVYPRAEMSMVLGSELLEAAAYPEDVLHSALTLLQAHVDQDLAVCDENRAADPDAPPAEPFLLMVWIYPLAEAQEADEDDDDEDDDDG